jgi:hypothetical protein
MNEGNLFFHFILVNIFQSLRTTLNFNSGYFEGRFPMNHQQGNDAATGADIQYRLTGQQANEVGQQKRFDGVTITGIFLINNQAVHNDVIKVRFFSEFKVKV